MDNNRNNGNSGTMTAAARAAYEGKAGIEAFERAGRNPNLKGVVHETLARDIYNTSPERLLDGTKAVLAKSTTAVRDDLLIMNGGKVVGRAQLKDTVNSIGKTLRQVKDGHYAGTNLMGTKETVAAYGNAVSNAGKEITQKMTSTGISSTDTSRIATQTIGSAAGDLTAEAIGALAVSSGAAGAAITGGIEAITSGVKLVEGEIDGEEFVGNVTKQAVSGGLAAAGGSAAASVATAAAATALAGVTAPAWIVPALGVGTAIAVGSAISGFLGDLFS